MRKIVLACFWIRESNCGDKSYVETFLEMTKRFSEDLSVEICDFYARRSTPVSVVEPVQPAEPPPPESIVVNWKTHLKNFIKFFVPKKIMERRWEKIKIQKYDRINRYYRERLDGAEALIIPGGGLVEYSSWRDYYKLMEMLEAICAEKNIPVFLNCLGYVENEPPRFWLIRWKKILNAPCVKHFTCRDNLPFFLKLNIKSMQVPCTACLAADVLGVSRRNDDDNTVGIGLMRYDCYSDYGNDISKEFLLNYYKDVILQLRNLGYKVALFSVGVLRDHVVGEEIMNYMKEHHVPVDGVSLFPRPLEVRTLLEQIAQFRGILTVRTHSAYAAFSLNVPAVMIYFGTRGWSGKSNEFMKMMGRPGNAICCDSISPKELVDKFQRAMEEGWNQSIRLEKKKECFRNFMSIMARIGIHQSANSPLNETMFS